MVLSMVPGLWSSRIVGACGAASQGLFDPGDSGKPRVYRFRSARCASLFSNGTTLVLYSSQRSCKGKRLPSPRAFLLPNHARRHHLRTRTRMNWMWLQVRFFILGPITELSLGPSFEVSHHAGAGLGIEEELVHFADIFQCYLTSSGELGDDGGGSEQLQCVATKE